MDKFPPPPDVRDLSALIIDNQGLIHDQITQALRLVGISRVKSAQNAYHALCECDSQTFDLIFIAFNTNSDKDGFHLYEELRHYQHISDKTSVIFLSAETSAELVNCIIEMQPDDFWVKPLDQKRIAQRLIHLLAMRKKLYKLLYCLTRRDYSSAIYYAERQLSDPALTDFHPKLRRVIGECLIALHEFAPAEDYYTGLLTRVDYAWAHVGLVRCLLHQNKLAQAEPLAETLYARPDTRFLMLDAMARYHIDQAQYDKAYENMKQASRLAPRNIERNKRLWDLARLNHDKQGQLQAVKNMARFAKNSIHDSPELQLNVVRATLDLAGNAGEAEGPRLLQQAEQRLDSLQNSNTLGYAWREQLDIIHARMLCLASQKQSAEAIMKTKKPALHGHSLEDNLDRMKAFHELGMKEHCLAILGKLRAQIEGDTFSSQVVNEYLQQEAIERRDIQFTPRELKEMATANYKEERFGPACNNLCQALVLAPQDRQVALSLLKVLCQLHSQGPLTTDQQDAMHAAVNVLSSADLPAALQQKRDRYCKTLQLELAMPEPA